MRDPQMMIALLKEMESTPDGQLIIGPVTFGMSIENRKRRHQVDLLKDEGLALWESESFVRITSDGYEALRALREKPECLKMVIDWVEKGKTIARRSTQWRRQPDIWRKPMRTRIWTRPPRAIGERAATASPRSEPRGRGTGRPRRIAICRGKRSAAGLSGGESALCPSARAALRFPNARAVLLRRCPAPLRSYAPEASGALHTVTSSVAGL